MATPYSDDGWGSSPPKPYVQREFGGNDYKNSNSSNYSHSASSSNVQSPLSAQNHNVKVVAKTKVITNLLETRASLTNGYGHTQSNGGTYISGNNLDELPVKDPIDPYGYAPNSYNNGSGDYAHAIPTPNITNGFNGLQQYLEELSQLTAQKCPMEDQARFLKDILFVVQTSAQNLVKIYHTYHCN